MRYLQFSLVLILSAAFIGSVRADDDPAEATGDRPGSGEFRQKMLEEFDADGDGQLSDDERAAARQTMRDRRGKRGAKGRRGSRDGEGRPNPEELFDEFDADGDGQLSREEFHNLAEAMHERHARHRQGKGRPGEGHGHRRGSFDGPEDGPGPPQKDRRDFRSPRPLQNPSDRPGRPPRAGKGRRGPGGSGARGIEGRHPPNPDEVFDRFDVDGDDQLSRAEFMKLSQAMREMHKHAARKGGKKYGKGHGGRRGPPGRGGPDRQGPPRSDSDDDGSF